MKKVNFYIAPPAYAAIKSLAERTGITFAEHLRRAIDAYLASLEGKK